MAKSAGYTTGYDPQIQYWSDWYGVPARVLKSMLIQESSLNPGQRTIGRDGVPAVGIAQFRPGTAQELGINPTDPGQSIAGAAAYFRKGINQGVANGNAQRLGINPIDYGVMYYNGGQNEQKWGAPGTGVWNYRDLVGGHYGSDESVLSRGLPQAGNVSMQGVDPRLTDIVTRAANYLPAGWHAEVASGYRENTPENPQSLHRLGQAVDIQLYDQNGQPVRNYQDPATFRAYEQYAQAAKKIQSTDYPELEPNFAWGGYFLDSNRAHDPGKLPYGAMDLMHFSVGNEHAAGGDWAGGLNAEGKRTFPGAVSVGMGPVAQYTLPATAPAAAPPAAQMTPYERAVVASGQTPTTRAGVPAAQAPAPVQVASRGFSDVPMTAGAPAAAQGPLPETWADVPGVPPSMRYAPPSMYTASTPQEQARWAQASTPRGYVAMQRNPQAATEFPGAPGGAPAPPLPERKPPVPTSAPGATPLAAPDMTPVITGGGTVMPPAGGSQGWGGELGAAGTQSGVAPREQVGHWLPPPAIRKEPGQVLSEGWQSFNENFNPQAPPPPAAPPGSLQQTGRWVSPQPSARATLPPPSAEAPLPSQAQIPTTGGGTVMPPAGGSRSWAGIAPYSPAGPMPPLPQASATAPIPPGAGAPLPSQAQIPQRVLSDEEVRAIDPSNAQAMMDLISRQDLTVADRAAITDHLNNY